MRLIEFSTRRPVTVLIAAVAAVVFGSVGLNRLATDLLPDMTYPSLTVRTTYDGAAPIEVESLVTRPVENGDVNVAPREDRVREHKRFAIAIARRSIGAACMRDDIQRNKSGS